MERHLPRAAGVYQIRCIPTGRIYIGSTVDIRARWFSHLRSLRKSKHRNVRLQRAWNKYGSTHFEMSVIELVDPPALLKREQFWIEQSDCLSKKRGFNVCPRAGSPGGTNIRQWTGFFDPSGREISITNLMEFCRRHSLDFPSMHRLSKGKSKLKSYKGWTHLNSIRQRDYIKTYEGFINPTEHAVEKITNLAAFCRENGLDKTHMVAVLRGRICSHRGWTHQNGRLRTVKTYRHFINPNGRRTSIVNLTQFCRENGLHMVHMHGLISGKRKTHKGWTWRKNDEASKPAAGAKQSLPTEARARSSRLVLLGIGGSGKGQV